MFHFITHFNSTILYPSPFSFLNIFNKQLTKPDNTFAQTSPPAFFPPSHPSNPPKPTSTPSSSVPRLTIAHISHGTLHSACASNPHSRRRTLDVTPAAADFAGNYPRGESAEPAARRQTPWCVTTHTLPPFRTHREESADREPKPRGTSILRREKRGNL